MDTNQVGCWIDITEEFKNSVAKLNLGELVKCDGFTLLEAMGAAELMDPKMDSGMIFKRSGRKILSFDQAVEQNKLKICDLQLDELLGIIDETFACFAKWLDGYSLSQTVMTNLYLSEPDKIEDRCLKLFCQSILRLVYLVDSLVSMMFCTVEEEDFYLNLNLKFPLPKNCNDQKLISSLEELSQHYEKMLSGRALSSNTTNQTKETLGESNNNSGQQHTTTETCSTKQFNAKDLSKLDKDRLRGLIDRMRFVHALYSAMSLIHRNIVTNEYELKIQDLASGNRVVKSIVNAATNCDIHLAKCLELLEKWRRTIDLGIKPDCSGEYCEGDYPTIMGFDPLINQRVLFPMYPRFSSMFDRPSALDYLCQFVSKMRHCLNLTNIFTQKQSFSKSINFIENFSKFHNPRSCVVTRSLMQLLYLPNRSYTLLNEELYQSLIEFCEPLVQLMKADEVKSLALDEFLTEASKSFSLLITLYGHNPYRQYDKIPDVIYSLKNLQYSAIVLNSAFANSLLYSWTTYHMAKISYKYILTGLEHDIYSFYEYPHVFWYMYENLLRIEHDQLEQTKKYLIDSQKFLDELHKKNKVKGKQRRKRFDTTFHQGELIKNEAMSSLTKGLFFLTFGLKKQGKILTPKLEFTSEEILFERRFAMLNNMNQYPRFRETIDELDNLGDIYKIAYEWLAEAKSIYQEISDEESLLKVSKINMVVAKILSTNYQDEAFKNRSVEFSFESHQSFPTLKIIY